MVAATHYEVLGVTPDASQAEIRRAYLTLARAHHPDFHGEATASAREDAERTMQRLNEAWLVLRDRRRRADYDLTLPAAGPPPPSTWVPGMAHPDFVPVDGDERGETDEPGDADEDAGTGRTVPTWQQLVPAACLVGALVALAGAVVFGGRALLTLGVVLLVAAGAGFVLTPMLAVLRTYERDPEP